MTRPTSRPPAPSPRGCSASAPSRPEDRLNRAWQLVLQRDPRPSEAETVRQLLDKHLADYRANPAAARALISTGVAPTPEGLDAAELAAWTHVARVLLNLHETVTRS